MDEEGYVKITGRIKDMIIRGGENIYPAEIESFIHSHPKVENVQVSSGKNTKMCFLIKIRGMKKYNISNLLYLQMSLRKEKGNIQ